MDRRRGGMSVCVFRGRDARVAPEHWTKCTSSKHKHVDFKTAQSMVDIGLWEWVSREELGRRRKAGDGMVRAVRVVGSKHWKKTMSRDGYSSTAVMQFVTGG